MKEIGDRLRRCPKDVCTVNNFDKIKDKVLEGKNVVGLVVSIMNCFFKDLKFIKKYFYLFLFVTFLCNKKNQNSIFGQNYMLKSILNHECRLIMAQEEMAVVHFYMAAQKNSSFSKLLYEEYIFIFTSFLNDNKQNYVYCMSSTSL